MRNSHVMVVSTLHEWPIITLIQKISCHRAVPPNGEGGGGSGDVGFAPMQHYNSKKYDHAIFINHVFANLMFYQ